LTRLGVESKAVGETRSEFVRVAVDERISRLGNGSATT
jgi:hypothetical protein